ncbi:CPBP family intramembrane glutamic endopeptidase [Clostridium sp. KNHs214]|uniref:CPBP family intramembrane glutamic endopeptidase n=1 Tax=Clostridium sp. KNHs214 TaxID=1540257 RepID=UPI0005524B46|nr:CPBP family intramembrane glutamic endopeptidase [Clostridium sp. KNHs214]
MKDKIDFLKEKHTLVLCILIPAIYLTILKCTNWIIPFSTKFKGYGLQLMAECIGIILSLIIMHLVGKQYILKEKGTGILKGLFVGGFLVVICFLGTIFTLMNVIENGDANKLLPLSQIAIFIATMIGIGISEEFIFRGTILNLLLDKFNKTPRGIYASIIISSVIFGAAHMTNVFSGVSIKSSFIQAVGAAVLGALIATIYLRTRNIWVVVILHAFMDFSSLIGSGLFGTNSVINQINSYSYVNFISYIIYLIPILVLLRKEKLLEIIENEKLNEYHKKNS